MGKNNIIPQLPIPYSEIFDKRTLIIMGVGRSGTTILGKLIASMAPTYYLFEPTIIKTMRNEQQLAALFEDYFLPIIQGSQTKYGTLHYGGPEDYWATSSAMQKQRRKTLSRRIDAFVHIAEEKPLFVIKTVNSQPYASNFRKVFPNCDFIHIVRNGFDVINSSVVNHWYTNKFYSFGNDYVYNEGNTHIPWYIEEDMWELWKKWDQITRAAYIWCYLTQLVRETLQYEELCENPEKTVSKIEETFPIKRTNLTRMHIDSVERHVPQMEIARAANRLPGNPVYEELTIDMIEEPVRSRFAKVMNKMGYEV
jgi:hypothetical protein